MFEVDVKKCEGGGKEAGGMQLGFGVLMSIMVAEDIFNFFVHEILIKFKPIWNL